MSCGDIGYGLLGIFMLWAAYEWGYSGAISDMEKAMDSKEEP